VRKAETEFRVVNNYGTRESTVVLTGLTNLLQKQLPAMPKAYIARLVYDCTHLTLAIVKMPLEVIGEITYREFRNRKFAGIVVCAISSDRQQKRCGAHVMAHFKDDVKAISLAIHFLAYANISAIVYFQKQELAKDVSLPKSAWMGFIEDYEGATLMQCTMLPSIRYLQARRMLLK
jgi:histone acetyltransferase